jgi:hypothetical protein
VGRAVIQVLDVQHSREGQFPCVDPGPAGYTAFQALLPSLSLCLNLRKLTLDITVSNIFRGDFDALKAYFGPDPTKPLVSTGLEKFANTLSALPRLESVRLDVRLNWQGRAKFSSATELFLCFACSGMREKKLITGIKKRLRRNSPRTEAREVRKLNGRATVWIDIVPNYGFDEGEETIDYEEWSREQLLSKPFGPGGRYR